MRRRVLTVAGVAAATLAIAGTMGVLAPRVSNDALPAIPTPTVTPTADPAPTITSTASPSATVTSSTSATASPTSTPSATTSSTGKPSRTTSPSSTPTRAKTPSPSSTPSAELQWSKPISVGGVSYRARLVEDGRWGDSANYKVELQADGAVVYTRTDAVTGEYGLQAPGDKHTVYGSHVGPIADVVSENGTPVSGEAFGSITLPFPGTSSSITLTVIRLPAPATVNEDNNVVDMVIRNTNGTEATLGTAHGD